MDKLRIIVGGFLGLLPAGGVTWDYVQYPLGFALLGHDVYYVEDTRLYPVYQKPGSDWNDASSCVAHLRSVMEAFGLGNRWAYRDEASGTCFGMEEKRLREICRTADVFVNVSCATVMRDEYAAIPVRVLIDSDPMFTQIQYATQQSFTPGKATLKELIDAHSHHFSFGENINGDDCLIPRCGLQWQPTRQPVCTGYWRSSVHSPPVPSFTTLLNWTAAKVLRYNNETWGQKDLEFQKIMALPKLPPHRSFALVMNQTGNVAGRCNRDELAAAGWTVLDPDTQAGNWCDYRRFLHGSYAEFSVAKQTYVKSNSGWFSCRSACYLAAGRPVVTQQTGWTNFIPAGEGLFSFNDLASAKTAVENLIAGYRRHCIAAKEIAFAYFDSNKILNKLLSQVLQPAGAL